MKMEDQSQPGFFRSLNTIFLALFYGQVLLLIIDLLLKQKGITLIASQQEMNIFLVIAVVFAAAEVIASRQMFSKALQGISYEESTENRLAKYRSAFIIRCALIEGASLMTLVFFLITGNYYFAGLWIILALFYFSGKPSKDKIATVLQLTEQEKAGL